MSILTRFKEIMESNANAVLDKMEDPGKMADNLERKAIEQLAEVKKETAEVMAQEKSARRTRDDLAAQVDKYLGLAQKAVAGGSDEDAKVFLTKKNELAAQLTDAQSLWETAKMNADRMIQMHDHLVKEIQNIQARKSNIKATEAAAKAQEQINKFHEQFSVGKASATMGAMEAKAKAKARLDAAQSTAELDARPVDEAEELAGKYGDS